LLLAVPACGLSDYEALMLKSQENEKRFREEEAYLGGPVQMPTQKNDKGEEQTVANIFIRLPKGVDTKPRPEPRENLMWQYLPRGGSNFEAVELAFGGEDKDFSQQVVGLYHSEGQFTQSTRQIVPAGQQNPISFDTWEFSTGQNGYSINVTQNRTKPVAIVYIYNKARIETVKKTIELSLQSLAVDTQVGPARQRYNKKSPWELKPTGAP
jgi:hypothetical protein